MAKDCYVCKKELGAFSIKFPYKDFLVLRIPIPNGMLKDDVACRPCFDEIKEAENEQSITTRQLLARTPEYKKQWDKNGIIQYKN
jgi:hypothetical protein